MSLPITDNRTRAAGDRVARADILSIQDSQIAGYQRGLRQQNTRRISAIGGRLIGGTWTIPHSAAPGVGGYYREAVGAGAIVLYDLGLPVGRRLRQISLRCFKGGASAIVLQLCRADRLASPVATVAIVSGGTVGVWSTIAAGPVSVDPDPILPGYRYYFKLTSGNAGDRVSWLRASADRP